MDKGAHFQYSFAPLGDHDRTSFARGVPELDRYFLLQAGQDARRKVAAPFVMTDASGVVLGYYTLSAYGIRLAELPAVLSRKLPKYPLIPATLLGRLAVHRDYRGQRLGRLLLMDALHRSWRSASEIASAGVVAEAIDEAARAFYLHHEFVPLLEQPRKLYLPMSTIHKALA